MQALANPAADSILSADKPLHRWLLALFMVTVILFGWKFPLLGFAVPVAMLTGMTGGFFRGRYVCGNICPRGSFYDTLFSFFPEAVLFRPLSIPPSSVGGYWWC